MMLLLNKAINKDWLFDSHCKILINDYYPAVYDYF